MTGRALPSLRQRGVSTALAPAEARETPLGRALAGQVAANPQRSGLHALDQPRDSFAARILLVRAAQRTLDVQYYIWRNDITGTLLLEALHAAAGRGVRVRLLLDDNGNAGLDPLLMALDTHPNIEVRLFNPFLVRKPKALGYLTDFPRANRRMHNKSLTADNQATIIGGRNIGDEYFGATDGVLFADLDLIGVGPVVAAVSADFDRYWASDSAYPAARILPPAASDALERLSTQASLIERSEAARTYVKALRELPLVDEMLRGELALEWSEVQLVSDDPRKGLGLAAPETLLPFQLKRLFGEPQRHFDLVSPYFVPSANGTEAFAEMVRRGVKVRVLTNALEATDVALVHSGYAKRRKELLEAGVQLYEMRRLSGTERRKEKSGLFGSSGSSLHAKTFAVDGSRAFVGSFNFDPRSARLNTELGFVVSSPSLARAIETRFDEKLRDSAYQVRLSDEGALYWLEQRGNGVEIRHDSEPNSGFWKRAMIALASLLPIESLL